MAKRILLVDDEPETRTVFETVLKQAGYEVQIAENGQQAVEKSKMETYDLILLDQMMPDLSGNEVLRMLKENGQTSQVKVAMLTNFSNDQMVNESLGVGAVDYILKYQISNEDLIKKVKGILGDNQS